MPVVRQRLLQAGVRLAGLLNRLFDPPLPGAGSGPGGPPPGGS
jgi:hypothetical protein